MSPLWVDSDLVQHYSWNRARAHLKIYLNRGMGIGSHENCQRAGLDGTDEACLGLVLAILIQWVLF